MKPDQHTVNYQIRIRGHIDDRWLNWCNDLMINRLAEGDTLICGMMDQASLHGLLNQIRDLGMELIYVQRNDEENQVA